MKYLLFYAIVFLSNDIIAQRGISFLKERETVWQNIEVPFTSEKKSLLLSPLQDIDNENAFHVLYLNADTLPDGIYDNDGKVRFFVNNGESIQEIGGDEGKLIGLYQNRPFEITTAHFLKKECCNNGYGYYQQWLIIPDTSGMTLKKLEKIYYSMDTEIPDFLNINLKFKLKERNILQNIPMHNDNIRQVSEYASGTRGYALSSKKDEKGNIWWFVILEPKLPNDKTVSNVRRMGWMQSSSLQVISH